MQILIEGDYIITTSGDINGFISPRLAFGHDSDANGSWLGIFAGLFFIGLVGTITRRCGMSRAKRTELAGVAGERTATCDDTERPVVMPSGRPSSASDEGVKIQQLKTLAALRDSGALTEKEFQAEKRRVLDGG